MSRNDSSKIAAYGPDMAEYLELLGYDSPTIEASVGAGDANVHFQLSGEGNPQAKLMFISEGPLNGPAEELLAKMIQAMGLGKKDVYIATLIQEGPEVEGDWVLQELQSSSSELNRSIEAMSPEVVVTLGQTRAKDWQKKVGEKTVAVFPTFHPAFLLRNADRKKDVWEDLKQVMSYLGSQS